MKLIRYIFKLSLLAGICSSSLVFADNNNFNNNTVKPVQKLDWQPCYQDLFKNRFCAKLTVPLSYDNLKFNKTNGKTIQISLIKISATNPSKTKLGSLIVNPGGPGGSGVNLILFAGDYLFNQDVRDQYDVVSFDPRGIGLSEPLTCGITFDQALNNGVFSDFPVGEDQEAKIFKANEFINNSCKKNANDIINHMTTANVARDMDLLRQAVGDKLLNFVGFSYGSYIGVTYANIFPENVGHLVVDGVLDPIEWSTGKGFESWFTPVTTRLGSDKGTQAMLNEFFRLCDLASTASCSFSGNSAARYEALLNNLKAHPKPIVNPDGTVFELTYQIFLNASIGSMYNSLAWPFFADLMLFTEGLYSPEEIGKKYARLKFELGFDNQTIPFDNFLGFSGVLCSDSSNPIDPLMWSLAAKKADFENGYFGAAWTWSSSVCANWQGSKEDRFIGPFNHRTKNPVLVMNMLFDPATPYAGAKNVARLLPNSRLVSVAGWAHTTASLSTCSDNIMMGYLLNTAIPAPESVCKQDSLPFVFPDGVDVFAGMPTDTKIDRDPSHHNFFDNDDNSDRKRLRRILLRNKIWH